MARLPNPGSDNGVWGALLNDFLAVEHFNDGSLRKADLITNAQQTADSKYTLPSTGIPETDLASSVQTKLNTVASGGVSSVSGKTGAVVLDKADVGLANVDNTTDLAKPISTATQTALNSKVTIESFDGATDPLKLIALSDGSVRAVPASLIPPAAPQNLVADAHLSYVRLTWDAVVGAVSYRVYKNGSFLLTRDVALYMDTAIAVGQTYQYYVQAVDQYGVWGAVSSTVSVLIDASTNSAPEIRSITIWPQNPRPTDSVYVHVNATDIDVHVLATALNTTVGSLTATFDPTTWKWNEV